MKELKITIATTAYNEERNIKELHTRCINTIENIRKEITNIQIEYCFVIADNGSNDRTEKEIEKICKSDKNVIGIKNIINYSAELSIVNTLRQCSRSDIFLILCSDLQDPPEVMVEWVKEIVKNYRCDAIVGVKSNRGSKGFLEPARYLYYQAMSWSSRLNQVPKGFHGFGCYRREAIEKAIGLYETTGASFRQCLIYACSDMIQSTYKQANRTHGVSSYKPWGYLKEAFTDLAGSDATTSRLALIIGGLGLITSFVIGILVLVNYLSGNSGYARGITTLAGLVITTFTIEIIMFGLLSRQIELLKINRAIQKEVKFNFMNNRDQTGK